MLSLETIVAGEPRDLARAISALEHPPPAPDVAFVEALREHGKDSRRIAFSGPGGVGKSSLLREIVRRLRARGDRVAVVAVDPASSLTSGAFLGDRYRFGDLLADPEVFVRSMAHRSAVGEAPPATVLAGDILAAAGYPWVLLESVGTGQMDFGGFDTVDLRVLVLSPQCGDDVQMMKAGAVELADIIVVTKADQPGGAAWAGRLEETLGVGTGDAAGGQKVMAVSASNGSGVDQLVETLVQCARVAR